MPSVFKRGVRWYAKYKDATGRWSTRSTTAETKTDAKRLATDLERQAERQRLGLEPLPTDGGTTLGSLLRWWEDAYFRHTPAYSKSCGTFHRHVVDSDISKLPMREVTSGRIEQFIQAKTRQLAPQTVNHLRGFLCRVFNAARRAGKVSQNPILDVKRRRTPRRLPEYLRVEEVPRVLRAVADRWRPLFAAAVYTGMRKGELLGLRKPDVDLVGRLISVRRSYARDTTKGGHAEAVPIASELVPYLEHAIGRSPSDLVFPREDGSMMSEEAPFEEMLRSALGRAGIVTGYSHICRRKGCGHTEPATDAELRRCPRCNMKLWPRAQVRKIRFHDLRHTTASLLMMAGANPAAVQRILRHSDPRITTEVYGHLAPDYLRREIDLLSFGKPANDSAYSGLTWAPIPAGPGQGFRRNVGAYSGGPGQRAGGSGSGE
jgi:integrase